MQIMNWLKLQPLLADLDPLNTRPKNALFSAIQALCAAGPRKVASRAEIFQFMTQGTDSRHYRHNLYTLTCFEAGNGWENIQ